MLETPNNLSIFIYKKVIFKRVMLETPHKTTCMWVSHPCEKFGKKLSKLFGVYIIFFF